MEPTPEDDFRQFVEASWHPLVRTAYLLTGDHGRAEDLVQQTLVKVHRHWAKVSRDGSPKAYTRAALANESASWWRRKRLQEVFFGPGAPEGHGLPPGFDRDHRDAHGAVDSRDALARAVLELPPRMRSVVVLRYYEELTEAETAHALGMSVGSVKSQTSRGLGRLRSLLDDRATTTQMGASCERHA